MLFATDLDNTLIYSYKKYAGGVCVEEKEGKPLSFMTERAYTDLQQAAQQRGIQTVPITTRSLEQFQRLTLLAAGEFAYALTGNGATLLCDGQVDADWQRETKGLIADALDELAAALRFLQQAPTVTLAPRLVDEAFVYAKSSQVDWCLNELKKQLDPAKVFVDHNGEKLYVFPLILTKGNALRRLQARIGADDTVAAGDSLFDLSMLAAADLALIPQSSQLQSLLAEHDQVAVSPEPGERFAEFVLQTVLARGA